MLFSNMYVGLIGPTQYPAVQREAFATLLEQNGVADPYNRVETSDIPLRQSS
jgi:hypothetical protein